MFNYKGVCPENDERLDKLTTKKVEELAKKIDLSKYDAIAINCSYPHFIMCGRIVENLIRIYGADKIRVFLTKPYNKGSYIDIDAIIANYIQSMNHYNLSYELFDIDFLVDLFKKGINKIGEQWNCNHYEEIEDVFYKSYTQSKNYYHIPLKF